MSWLSNIGSSIGKAFKSVGSTIKTIGSGALSVVKKVATPLLSTAASLVPGIGPLLAAGVDILGNKLLGGDSNDASMDSGQVEQSPAMDAVAQATGQVVGLGSSPAAQAMSASIANEDTSSAVKKGFLGIGDAQPGVFGIGTGKAKAKKDAAQAAREYAERAAAVDGLTPNQIKLAGDTAAAKASAEADKDFDASGSKSSFSPIAIAGGILAALLLL